MANNRDYSVWDENYEDPAHWARPGSSEAINRNRQLRRKPSSEDRLIRQKNRRTAADEGDQVAMDRAEIQRQIMRAASFQEKLAWVDALDAYDRQEALRTQASRTDVGVQNDIAERMTPTSVYQAHTASTDWLGEVDTTPSDWHQRVAAEAAVWYAGRPDFVKTDREELGIQAQGKANQIAGQYGRERNAAYRTFLDYVAFVSRTAEVEDGPGEGAAEGGSEGGSTSTTNSGSGSAASGANGTASTPSSTGTATPPSSTSTATPPVVAHWRHEAASGLDQIQQVTAPDGVTQKSTPLPPAVFDNFAPEIHSINQGVSGSESSTRNQLIQEIMSGGSHMDGGSAEQVGGHSTTDDLSWSPPSGMQKDTAPGWSDGDPGSPEDRDEHNTGFGSDSQYSKHVSMHRWAVEEGLAEQNADGPSNNENYGNMGPSSIKTPKENAEALINEASMWYQAGELGADDANLGGGGSASGKPSINDMNGLKSEVDEQLDKVSYIRPGTNYAYTLDDFRRMQAEAARRAEGKGDGRRGGRTAANQHVAFGWGDVANVGKDIGNIAGGFAHDVGDVAGTVGRGAGDAAKAVGNGVGAVTHMLPSSGDGGLLGGSGFMSGWGSGSDGGGGQSGDGDGSGDNWSVTGGLRYRASAEKKDEHTKDDDLSWSPPSGQQHDSKPPVSHEAGVDYSNHTVQNHGGRWHVVGPSGESEGGHRTEGAAHEHLNWLQNKSGSEPDHIHGGGIGGAGWHQPTRYASYMDEQGKNRADEDYDPRERYPHSYSRDDIKKALDAHEMDEGSHEKMGGLDGLFYNAASGLDQIDQVIDPNNNAKRTDYPTDVMFPLGSEFADEYSTHGTGNVSKGQDNPQPSPQHNSAPAPDTNAPNHHSAAKSEPYYSTDTPQHVYDASQDAEHFTNRALHSGNAHDHVRAAHEHANALNSMYDSGYSDNLLEAHHKGRMQYHEDRAHKLHSAREARILNKVADMFGASDMPHKILAPVPNNSGTTPERPDQASRGQGSKDCATPNTAPTFSDNSSHIPSGANSYAEGYSDRDKDNYAPKNTPPSMGKPGEGVTHAGSMEDYVNERQQKIDAGNAKWPTCPSCHGTGSMGKKVCGTCKGAGKVRPSKTSSQPQAQEVVRMQGEGQPEGEAEGVEKTAAPKPYGDVKYADPSQGKYPIDTDEHIRAAESYVHQDKNKKSLGDKYESTEKAIDNAAASHGIGDHKTSHLITTAADRSNPEFMKGYFYGSNWKVTIPVLPQGNSSFEAGLYAGLTDTPSVRPHFVQASKDRGMVDRINRHASITQDLAKALGVKVANTSLYLDTIAPNTTPNADGSTPINGRGKPGPLDGKETGNEPAGGPSPYNGTEPKGHSVVPGATAPEPPHPTDQLVPMSGYTTPRAVEKASAFRRKVQAALREANKR